MGIYITDQVRVFVLSVLLGIAVGAVYDMVGAVRSRFPKVTALVDVGYGLGVLGTVFLFVLRQSQGQLRLFVLMGLLGGCVLFFTGLSQWLRPVWGFWVDCFLEFVEILALPGVISGNLLKTFRKYLKKRFYFWHKYSTMRYHPYTKGEKGGISRGKTSQPTRKKAKS